MKTREIKEIKEINETLSLVRCVQTYTNNVGEEKTCGDHGYWLYDKNFGMNLAIREETKEAALIKALIYYQKRFLKEKEEHEELLKKVNSFLCQFPSGEEDGE